LGPNGSGKSTLLKLLSTLLHPQAGTAAILGYDLISQPAEIRKEIAVAFQSPSLDSRLTIRENLRHQGLLYGYYGDRLIKQIDVICRLTNLQDRQNEKIDALSGGYKRRADLARCLMHQPRLLLLDEPTAGLDPAARQDFWKLIRQIHHECKTTILFTTHYFNEVTGCDLIGIMDTGKMIAFDSPASLSQLLDYDVITITATNQIKLYDELKNQYSITMTDNNHGLRIETHESLIVAPKLWAEYQTEITSITVSKATLEDIYFHKTGKVFALSS
jgi:ABC-2 type transport system ATP-binding protein